VFALIKSVASLVVRSAILPCRNLDCPIRNTLQIDYQETTWHMTSKLSVFVVEQAGVEPASKIPSLHIIPL